MTLTGLRPFDEALKTLAARHTLPTALDSAEIRRQLSAALRRQSFFSAQTTLEGYLEDIRGTVADLLNPKTAPRADRVTETNPEGNVTTGLNPATARLQLKEALAKYGYAPEPGQRDTLKDLASDARLNLVIKTNTELAQGAGFAVQSNDPAVREAFPCWELYRLEDKEKPRDWESRWRIAAAVAPDVDAARVLEETGRMIARKDSQIWEELGAGAGGYTDTLDNPYPPFAFNSGMWTIDVDWDEAEKLGLVNADTKVESNLPDDLAQLFEIAA